MPEDATGAAHPDCRQKLLGAMTDDSDLFQTVAMSLDAPFNTVEGQRELWVALFGEDARG